MQKHNKKYTIAVLWAILCSICVQAQEQQVRSIIEKVEAHYKKASYRQDLKYNFYTSYTNKEPYQTQQGFFKKEGEAMTLKIDQTEMTYSEGYSVMVSHSEKAVVAQKVTAEQLTQKNPASITSILPWIEKFELKASSEQFICTLYTSEITQLPYSRIVLIINKKNHTMVRQVSYFNQQKKYTTQDGQIAADYPRLEISFSDLKPILSPIRLSDYIRIQPSGALKVASNISNYEIIEQ